jgi:hypothetical protein
MGSENKIILARSQTNLEGGSGQKSFPIPAFFA